MTEVPATPPSATTPLRSVVAVAAGAMVISFAPILVRALVPDRLGPSACAGWRTLIGGLALATIVVVRRIPWRLDRTALRLALLAGLLFALDLVTWHHAIQIMPRAGAGLATVLANTQVVWVALYGTFVLGERGGARLVLAVVLAIVGVALLGGVLTPAGLPAAPAAGVMLGLLTGVWYASFLLVVRRSRRGTAASKAAPYMAMLSLVAAVLAFAAAGAGGEAWALESATDVLYVVLLGVVMQAGAWWLLLHHLARIPAALGALLLLIQPTFSALWGVLIHGERLTLYEVGGVASILLGLWFGSQVGRRKHVAPAVT